MRGERQLGNPYRTTPTSPKRLKRIRLTDKLISEHWLQEKLHAHPDLLPLDELDPTFRDSVSLCREMRVKGGYVDNVFISPEGYLTLVETKLYRNPQARREVVGQIIDYAKDLSQWTFSELDAAVRTANSDGRGVLEVLTTAERTEPDNEGQLIYAIDRGLRRGEMLLLIVGDGIHESVEDMAEYIQVAPQLRFGLGLVELQLYALSGQKDDVLILPRVVTRTREVVRAVIHVNTEATTSTVSVTAAAKPPVEELTGARTTITETSFFEALRDNTDAQQVAYAEAILERARSEGYIVDWNQGSFAVKYPDPEGSARLLSLMVVDKRGQFYLMPTQRQLERIGLPGELGIEYARRMAAVIPGAEPGVSALSCLHKYMRLSAVGPVTEQVFEVTTWFVGLVEESS